MTARHTFHTPSFGDEEFELPTTMQNAAIDHTFEIPSGAPTHFAQWQSMGNQSDQPLKSGPLTGNEFLVLRPTATTTPALPSESNSGQLTDTNIGSDDSDDNALKSGIKHMSPSSGAHEVKKIRRRDPNEPQKPVSAYALFFRDTQAAIKGQNPNAEFGEVSKIVASMWDALDPEHKNVYKKKNEAAKKEYLKKLAAYRANAIAKGEDLSNSTDKNAQQSPQKLMSSPFHTPPVQRLNEFPPPQSLESSGNQPEIQMQLNNHQQTMTGQPGIAEAVSSSNSDCPQNVGMLSPDNPQNTTTNQTCVRNGCTNLAVVNVDWEDEYCSNECVISHCRDVFTQWVQANSLSTESYPTT